MSEQTINFFYDFGQYLLYGLSQGSLYALVALGYTMVYGIIKLINFAHGEFYMIGALTGYYCAQLNLPAPLCFLFAMIIPGIMAVLVERAVYRPIRHAGRIPALITALGASLFFQYFTQLTIGADPKAFPELTPEETYFIGEIYVTNIQIYLLISSLVLMGFLYWLVNKTLLGKAMRATSFNRNAAELMGIDTDKIISATFFIGASFAGAAGVLVGLYSRSIDPMMGLIPGLKAFIAAVLGGIGVIPGALLGGFTLGIAENIVVAYGNSTYRDAVAFSILIFILLIRPAGLLGKNIKEKV